MQYTVRCKIIVESTLTKCDRQNGSFHLIMKRLRWILPSTLLYLRRRHKVVDKLGDDLPFAVDFLPAEETASALMDWFSAILRSNSLFPPCIAGSIVA